MKAKVSEQEFVRICHTSKSIAEIARTIGIDDKGVKRRMASLKPKYGCLKPKGFHPQQNNYHKTTHHHIKDKPYTIVFFTDAHFWPAYYQEPTPSFKILLQVLKDIKPDVIHDNGDSFDGAGISRHPPRGWQEQPTPAEELECNIEFHDMIKDASPKSELIWCYGNHDGRFDSYLASHAGVFKDVKGFSLESHFPDWNMVESVNYNDTLFVRHNWHGGINAARNNTLKSGKSFGTGHLHKLTISRFTDFNGTRYGLEFGTIADPTGDQFFYTGGTPVDWQTGFMVVTIDGDRIYPEAVEVIDGKTLFRGKEYGA